MDSDNPKYRGDMPTNPTLTEVFNRNKLRHCSLELSSNKPVPLDVFEGLKVNFCSVIWLGSYDTKPEEIASMKLAKDLISRGHTVVLHVTARNNTKNSLSKVLDYAKFIGVRNLLCLRGGSQECKLQESKYDFPHTPDMLKYIKANYGDHFEICVAGFPYKHPDSKTLEDDMKFLKEKCDAGAKYIITQAGFSYDIYKQFLTTIRKNKINLPVIPGVYVIQSVVDFCLLKKLCKVPQDDPAIEFVKENKDKDDEIAAFGWKLSTEIVKKLIQDTDFLPPHIFSMNEFRAIENFLKSLREHK
ncbi:methylenetetrahydrofolate reductase-like [Coccinella septempunctata]|uniref:methylenetetrahydrofolate reductase-like n=1 Tax=Coccinella septempunctata TaxID=41139 RepID=UPI001D07AAE4|nr:methylenetetrahydrofolate reductase-like [Coccinella septempunctata]